jgi:hypothetical protein
MIPEAWREASMLFARLVFVLLVNAVPVQCRRRDRGARAFSATIAAWIATNAF